MNLRSPSFFRNLKRLLCNPISPVTMYTLSDKGIPSVKDPAVSRRVLILVCLELPERIKDGNQPVLTCRFLSLKPLEYHESAMEKMMIKRSVCMYSHSIIFHERMGIPIPISTTEPPLALQSILLRSRLGSSNSRTSTYPVRRFC